MYKRQVTVKRDDSDPTVTPTATGTQGDNGWYVSDVNVTWDVSSDHLSGVTADCPASNLTSDNPGTTYTCTATTGAGRSGDGSITVKRDATVPSVALAGNTGSYTVDQNVSITCSISDNLSGVATQNCSGASGSAYTFGFGSHAVSASATDNAGHSNSASGSFTVTVTLGSLCNLVNAWVTQRGVANSLCQQLANGAYGAFRNHLEAQSGKHVPADKAAILSALSLGL